MMNGAIGITTSEKDIDVKYGIFDFGPERDMARASLKYIYSDICDIKRSYFKLGFHLNEFKICEYYKDFGYATFEEFCDNHFDMDKSAISGCINVFFMTSAINDIEYVNGIKKCGCASSMSSKFKDFSYSQLCEMLPMDDDQRDLVSPNMTIKEIRELKKGKVATSQSDCRSFDTFDLACHIVKYLERTGCVKMSFNSNFVYFISPNGVNYKIDIRKEKDIK